MEKFDVIRYLQFFFDIPAIGFDRFDAKGQFPRDLARTQTTADEAVHLQFPVR